MREVSRRLGVSTHSLYKWLKLFGEPLPKPGTAASLPSWLRTGWNSSSRRLHRIRSG
ncbi:hypothetical protein [Jannaschia pohangensis]|uniref:hypothetical protein n=1 Tax=Jannaschia pohangensis TaxID=390807 RepID=UPI001FE23120|nr:hypothetical protein [Jannaschia pohangensis]